MDSTGSCYCGSALSPTSENDVYRCGTCKRLYLPVNAEATSFRLLVPWKKFFRRSQKDILGLVRNCPRCGGETDFDGQNHRYTCNDCYCGYSWYEESLKNSPAITYLNRERENLLLELAKAQKNSNGERRVIESLLALKERGEILKQEIL